jgi:hypothetical protein
MTISTNFTGRFDSLLTQRWNTQLNGLRFMALLAFAAVLSAALFPKTASFCTGAAVSLTGSLALQLFLAKRLEGRPEPEDTRLTTLGIGK